MVHAVSTGTPRRGCGRRADGYVRAVDEGWSLAWRLEAAGYRVREARVAIERAARVQWVSLYADRYRGVLAGLEASVNELGARIDEVRREVLAAEQMRLP